METSLGIKVSGLSSKVLITLCSKNKGTLPFNIRVSFYNSDYFREDV